MLKHAKLLMLISLLATPLLVMGGPSSSGSSSSGSSSRSSSSGSSSSGSSSSGSSSRPSSGSSSTSGGSSGSTSRVRPSADKARSLPRSQVKTQMQRYKGPRIGSFPHKTRTVYSRNGNAYVWILLFSDGRTEAYTSMEQAPIFDINNLPAGCTSVEPTVPASAPIIATAVREQNMPLVFKEGNLTISCELVDVGAEKRRLSGGAIAGIVIGSIAGVICLVAIPLTIIAYRRRKLVKRPSLKLQAQSV